VVSSHKDDLMQMVASRRFDLTAGPDPGLFTGASLGNTDSNFGPMSSGR